MEGGSVHVIGEVYAIQSAEFREFLKTGKESKRMLALRGVSTDIELPRHLKELLEKSRADFDLKLCYYLTIKCSLMGSFPAILKGTRIEVITPDRASILRIWESLKPRDSEIVEAPWMVHKRLNVGYWMSPDDRERSLPHGLFTREEIEAQFAGNPQPFEWAHGLIGAQVSLEQFREIINRNR